MSASLVMGGIWVLAATVTAFLSMRRQYVPGLALLILAPLLIAWIAVDHGPWVGAFGLFAVLSMFRRPLLFLGRRALSLPVEAPPR